MIQTIAAQGGFDFQGILFIIIIGVIFWFFLIRPQKKRQQEIQNFRNSITIGAQIVTAGGVYGEVRAIDEAANILTVEIAKGVSIRVDRNSVYATAQANQTN